jgi:hypothetical protein
LNAAGDPIALVASFGAKPVEVNFGVALLLRNFELADEIGYGANAPAFVSRRSASLTNSRGVIGAASNTLSPAIARAICTAPSSAVERHSDLPGKAAE